MVGHDAHERLFRALVGDGPVGGLVRDGVDAAPIEAALRELRNRQSLEIVSLAVNGERVDVTARGGELEWRVVFGTSDAVRVDWLSVHRRPPAFAGVAGGRVVVVNGPSSAGKSTVLAAIASSSDLPWVVFDEPMFGAVDAGYLIWRDRAEVLHRGFLDGIAALARAGNYVALAAGGHPAAWFDEAFASVPALRVGLDCQVAELLRRERGRRDVQGGLATASPDIHAGWQYDLCIDTTDRDATSVAATVLAAIDAEQA